VNGTARVQGNATFGNGIVLNLDGSLARVFSASRIRYQSNSTAVQHSFVNQIGGSLNSNILNIEYGSSEFTRTTGSQSFLSVNGRLGATSGLAEFNIISAESNTITNSGTFTGVYRGVFVNFSGISGSGYSLRALETVSGNVLLGTTSGSVGIGANTLINASAILDITSTTKGFLPPRMTTTEKNAIASPATGLVVYDNTLNKLSVFTGATWETVTSL
jgi:hypothetical protein